MKEVCAGADACEKQGGGYCCTDDAEEHGFPVIDAENEGDHGAHGGS